MLFGGRAVTGPIVFKVSAIAYDPFTQGPAANAQVSMSGGGGTVPLAFDQELGGYGYQLEGGQPIDAKVATYTLSVTHSIFGAAAVTMPIGVQPLAARPAISSPIDGKTFAAPQAIEVAWTDAPGAEPWFVWVFDKAGDGDPAFAASSEDGTLTNPLTIPAEVFAAGREYEIGVYGGRESDSRLATVRSTEAAMDYVTVKF